LPGTCAPVPCLTTGYRKCVAATDCSGVAVCCIAADTSYGTCLVPDDCAKQSGEHYEECVPGGSVCGGAARCEMRSCPIGPGMTESLNVCTSSGGACVLPP
jgi:hypothetical protein